MSEFIQRFEVIYKKFAERAAAEGRPASKLAFARFVGVSQGCMQKWEKGQIPNAKDLITIRDKLGFSLNWLITGEGNLWDESMLEVDELKARIAVLEAELREADRINRKLTTRLLVDGVGDKDGATNIGRAGGGHK